VKVIDSRNTPHEGEFDISGSAEAFNRFDAYCHPKVGSNAPSRRTTARLIRLMVRSARPLPDISDIRQSNMARASRTVQAAVASPHPSRRAQVRPPQDEVKRVPSPAKQAIALNPGETLLSPLPLRERVASIEQPRDASRVRGIFCLCAHAQNPSPGRSLRSRPPSPLETQACPGFAWTVASRASPTCGEEGFSGCVGNEAETQA